MGSPDQGLPEELQAAQGLSGRPPEASLPRLAVLLVLAAPLLGAPTPELLREEAYNYRIVGELPRGWQRRPNTLAFAFAVDDIPHAFVHLVRGHLDGAVDVQEQLLRRASQYRFPGAPEGAETVRKEPWAGHDAFVLDHEAVVNGVPCRRHVCAMVVAGVWYERIETVYGAATEEMPACRDGLRVFREGFRLLVEPLPAAAREDTAERSIEDPGLGFRILKPEGFVRRDVDLTADPGLRVALEARLPDPRHGVVVRLFEYGVREDLDARKWLDGFFSGFGVYCAKATREPADAPAVRGATGAEAERFRGVREGREIEELLILVRAKSGRVFCLRIRTTGDAGDALAGKIGAILASLQVDL